MVSGASTDLTDSWDSEHDDHKRLAWKRVRAIKPVEFCYALYKFQIQQGRRFLHEHVWTPRSWKSPCVADLRRHSAVDIAQGLM